MLGTRPDIAYSVIKTSQFSVNPTEEHLQKALYIVRYLSSTMDLCICYSSLGDRNGFIAYSDMDWGGDIETSRSFWQMGLSPGFHNDRREYACLPQK